MKKTILTLCAVLAFVQTYSVPGDVPAVSDIASAMINRAVEGQV